MNRRRGWRAPGQVSAWHFLGMGVAALGLFLVSGQLAGAAHYDSATIQAIDECEPTTEADTQCRVAVGGIADTAGPQPIPGEIGAFEIELWGGGGGGGGGGSVPTDGGGGGGGGGGGYAAITLVRGTHFDDGDCIEFSVGEGGGGGEGSSEPAGVDQADPGTDGTASTVTIHPDCGGTGTAYSAGGGAGGGDGVLPLFGGDGGAGGEGGAGDWTGGDGGAGGGVSTGGGGGGGSAFHDGNGGNGTDGTRVISPAAFVGGTGGDGTGEGGDGGSLLPDEWVGYRPHRATAAELPGGGGGGGTFLGQGWDGSDTLARDGTDGADGVILATWYVPCDVAPCVTKTAQTSINGQATWLITVDNGSASAQAVRIEDADVAFYGYGSGNDTGAVCDPAAFDANDQIECDVPADGTLELLVTRDLISCTETTADNLLQGFEWWDGESWVAIDYPDDVATTTVPVDADDCWQPVVAKTGLETDRRFSWEIEIDNRPPGSSTLEAVDVQVRLTDPFVSLVPDTDGGCTQSGSPANRVIECDVAAGEELRFRVWREAPEPTCESQYDSNSISLIEVAFDLGDGYGAFEDFGPGPQDVRGEMNRGEGSCLPPWYVLPVPDPDPADAPPPPSSASECDLDQATWAPSPVSPGFTISRWGGGNVDEFPPPLATSYWTTVDGELIGYIPGAPEWVNSEFFAAFPNGEIPACAAFIVAHR